MAKRHPDHEQADSVVCRVAEEVEGVGLQRRRSSSDTSADLDQKHDGVDRQYGPQHAAKGWVSAMRVGQSAVIAAVGAHGPPQWKYEVYLSTTGAVVQSRDGGNPSPNR